MHHGLNNTYIYAVSKITLDFSNGIDNVSIQGTGFFIVKGEDLYLITNRHVVQLEWKEPKYQGYKLQSIKYDCRNYNETSKTVDVDEIEMKSYNVLFAENNIDDIACITNTSI